MYPKKRRLKFWFIFTVFFWPSSFRKKFPFNKNTGYKVKVHEILISKWWCLYLYFKPFRSYAYSCKISQNQKNGASCWRVGILRKIKESLLKTKTLEYFSNCTRTSFWYLAFGMNRQKSCLVSSNEILTKLVTVKQGIFNQFRFLFEAERCMTFL